MTTLAALLLTIAPPPFQWHWPDVHDDAAEMGELLKSRGELGWELVSVARADGRRELYFKRPKEAVPDVG